MYFNVYHVYRVLILQRILLRKNICYSSQTFENFTVFMIEIFSSYKVRRANFTGTQNNIFVDIRVCPKQKQLNNNLQKVS